MLKLTGILQDNGTWTDLQFSGFGQGLAPMHFPSRPGSGKENFFFSNSDGSDGYLVHVRFTVAGTSYRLFSRQMPPAGGDDMGGGEAGLDIIAPDGGTRRVVCDGKPDLFIGYIHEAVACDLENPLGKSACDYRNVPQRAVSDVALTRRP
ncbi:hypothetical protein [Pararhizobium gei]|uniref:hypothetical protein n=1 Tax=Pararhizobium gei TaxID=1395951 RepID=UPI0023DB1B6D|nr:hypothetical protein [Rhizobium gei]